MNRLPNECVPQCEKMHRQIERIRESMSAAQTTDTQARRDVELQRQYDPNRASSQELVLARMAAVMGAQRAAARRDAGAVYALRQSLIDLAAAAELAAEEMVPTEDWPAPRT
jgi:hypothetical protein